MFAKKILRNFERNFTNLKDQNDFEFELGLFCTFFPGWIDLDPKGNWDSSEKSIFGPHLST